MPSATISLILLIRREAIMPILFSLLGDFLGVESGLACFKILIFNIRKWYYDDIKGGSTCQQPILT